MLVLKAAAIPGIGYDLFSTGTARWAAQWWSNRQAIVAMTTVNTGITAGMEYLARTTLAPLFHKEGDKTYSFIVHDSMGNSAVNRQSLINIFMTLFASLVGGPVYFFLKTRHRYLFFFSFGFANALFGQAASSVIRDGIMNVIAGRLLFDLAYNGSVKYFMFEWMRKPIVKAKTHLGRLMFFRISQDFLSTMIRVVALNLLGFRG